MICQLKIYKDFYITNFCFLYAGSHNSARIFQVYLRRFHLAELFDQNRSNDLLTQDLQRFLYY